MTVKKLLNYVALFFWTTFTIAGFTMLFPIIFIVFILKRSNITKSLNILTRFWFLKSNYIFKINKNITPIKNTLFVAANNHFAVHMFYYATLPADTYFFMGFCIKNKLAKKIMYFFRIIPVSPNSYQQIIEQTSNLKKGHNYFILLSNKTIPDTMHESPSNMAAYIAINEQINIIPTIVINPRIYKEHYSFWKKKEIQIRFEEKIDIKKYKNTKKDRQKLTKNIHTSIKNMYQADKPPSTTMS